jgi:hypothetical protein
LLSKNLKIKIYRTIILPVVLYGCETWLLTLREECRLRGFENMVLKRVFGPKRDEVTEEWRKLHNEEMICTRYPNCSGGKIEKNQMGVACGAYGGGVHRVLVGKLEGKMPLGRPRRRWEDNIKMIFRNLEGVVRTGLSWLRIGTGGGHL